MVKTDGKKSEWMDQDGLEASEVSKGQGFCVDFYQLKLYHLDIYLTLLFTRENIKISYQKRSREFSSIKMKKEFLCPLEINGIDGPLST